MSSKVKQTNAPQAGAAFQGASTEATNLNNLGDLDRKQSNQLFKMLYGMQAPTGPVGSQLDPAKLDMSKGLQGPFSAMYNTQAQQTAQQGQNALSTTKQDAANRGFNLSGPASTMAELQTRLGTNATNSTNYANAFGNQYSTALNNFWNAANTTAGMSNSRNSDAINAYGNSGQLMSNMYGTAGQGHVIQNPAASIIGSGVQAGATVGAAAMCTAEGTLILLANGDWIKVQDLKKDHMVKSIDGGVDRVLLDPIPSLQHAVKVKTQGGRILIASVTHTLARKNGGYALCGKCKEAEVLTQEGPDVIASAVHLAAKEMCYHLMLDRTHTYSSNGIWSLE